MIVTKTSERRPVSISRQINSQRHSIVLKYDQQRPNSPFSIVSFCGLKTKTEFTPDRKDCARNDFEIEGISINMLRSSAETIHRRATVVTSSDAGGENGGTKKKYNNAKNKASPFVSKILCPIILAISLLIAVIAYDTLMTVKQGRIESPRTIDGKSQVRSKRFDRTLENLAFENVINRTRYNKERCQSLGTLSKANNDEKLNANNHTAHLPPFGFLDAVASYKNSDPKLIDSSYPYKCELPPENECGETKFTVIFMAYNPDRLDKLSREIKKMLTEPEYSKMVAEVIVVWNGERHVDETALGKKLLDFGKTLPFRISYPLKAGFPNDLMNRYHPRLGVKTKAILYYDDDGPFYATRAIKAGFELWKRNSNAQIGAMARKIDIGDRQIQESLGVSKEPNDRFFVSHCPTDEVRYNYFTFANFDARMVLPSGSFLHSNYLCLIWHPVFEDIRKYVRDHPVNPDDGTVSMLVSQLAGRAPKVYSRRLPPAEKETEEQQHRRLMDGIDWDSKGDAKSYDKKMYWGRLRSDVANSLGRYFGSVNSGSLGWCYGTEHHIRKKNQNLCHPEMAKVGMLPWMKADNSEGAVCPSQI